MYILHTNTYTQADAYTYIHVCLYTYIHTHIYAHTYNMYICTHASTPGTKALQQLREELMQTPEALHVSFVQRNQPHLARPMLGLHCTHFLRHQYPPTPHPLFTTYPRTVRGPRASAILLFHTHPMNRVHSSEEASRSFTMAPCVAVERLEGRQRCSRAPVDEHAVGRARRCTMWLFTRNERSAKNKQTSEIPYLRP